MSNQEFENYLKLIGKLLQLSRSQQKQISGELRDHLQSRVADLVAEGVAHEQAVGQAIEEFGDAAAMAKNFQAVTKLKRRRWMMRFATLSMAAAFFLAVFSMAMWPSTARFGSPEVAHGQDQPQAVKSVKTSRAEPSSSTQRDLATEAVLRNSISLIYEDVAFRDVVADLEDQTKLNFYLDQSAKDDSLTMDETITFRIINIPLEKALSMMLREKNATFNIDEGVVVFISLDDAQNADYMRVRMFNCKELVEKLASASGNRAAGGGHSGMGDEGGSDAPGGMSGMGGGLGGPGGGMGGMGGGMGGMGGGMMGGGIAHAHRSSVESKQQMLLGLVHTMITPEEWDVTVGGLASAQIINGVLIVKHRQSAFGEIESLLQDLAFEVDSKTTFAKPAIRNLPKNRRPKTPKADPFDGGNGAETNPFGDD